MRASFRGGFRGECAVSSPQGPLSVISGSQSAETLSVRKQLPTTEESALRFAFLVSAGNFSLQFQIWWDIRKKVPLMVV